MSEDPGSGKPQEEVNLMTSLGRDGNWVERVLSNAGWGWFDNMWGRPGRGVWNSFEKK